LNFAQIEGYNTGGTIHLVINNQIGFTTDPHSSRSTEYCTDAAIGAQAPVIHVNGDDPEVCVWAMQLALNYRQKFHRDVFVDLLCYRKHGHNEGDDASYTQPLMARRIADHKSPASQYAARLVKDGVVTAEEVAAWQEQQKAELYQIYDQTQKSKEAYELHEMNPVSPEDMPTEVPPTSVDRAALERVLTGITRFPDNFLLHPKLVKMVEKRHQAISGAPVDWATAEALAFGTLLLEGTPVRLSGQDSGRGTFSQRHAEYHDYNDNRLYAPLQHLADGQAKFEIYNSPLSEYGVLGFEFGVSIADPLTLVLWEAQYGDFCNGAQIIIDQFLVSAESKWGQPSGLVMLLPHGQEGGGPEHSSARMERFLQLAGERNICVAAPTTPAQYFHLLRRQMRGGPDRRGLRKPLIVMTAKSLLRHPKCVSTLEELTGGAFLPVVADDTINAAQVKRVQLCTGKIYFELLSARETRGATDTAIVRLPQLYPFPKPEFQQMLKLYPNAEHIVWVQEEPRNMGAWPFLRGRISPLLNDRQRFGYAGRPESASTAPGSPKQHAKEQADVLEAAYAPPTVARRYRKGWTRKPKSQK
jgi:2-oxoglutarate dehydrogenase E1 component